MSDNPTPPVVTAAKMDRIKATLCSWHGQEIWRRWVGELLALISTQNAELVRMRGELATARAEAEAVEGRERVQAEQIEEQIDKRHIIGCPVRTSDFPRQCRCDEVRAINAIFPPPNPEVRHDK